MCKVNLCMESNGWVDQSSPKKKMKDLFDSFSSNSENTEDNRRKWITGTARLNSCDRVIDILNIDVVKNVEVFEFSCPHMNLTITCDFSGSIKEKSFRGEVIGFRKTKAGWEEPVCWR
jgi:hypothetical protein